MIDGAEQKNKDGKVSWVERSDDDIARIRRLVQSAIGYDEKRGDKIEVVSMRFAPTEMGDAAPSTGLLGLDLQKSDILGLGQSAILALIVLLALVFVLRPMALRLSAFSPQGALAEGDALLAPPAGSFYAPALSAPSQSGGEAGVPMLSDESMVNMTNVDGQLRASSIRKLADMVEKHPEESLSIMRGWMTAEQG